MTQTQNASGRIPTPAAAPPDILRCAYMELVVTDLVRSRDFYVDVLNLVVTAEDEDAIYLRSMEEFIHHNLVLRRGEQAAVAAFSYRVRSPQELDKAESFSEEKLERDIPTGLLDCCEGQSWYFEAPVLERLWRFRSEGDLSSVGRGWRVSSEAAD